MHQWHKAQARATGGRFVHQPRIRLSVGHGLCHRCVRGLVVVVAVQHMGCQARFGQQFVQQHAGACAQRAVHPARLCGRHVGQGVQPQWVARGHHQTHAAQRKPDEFVPPGLEQRFVGARRQRAGRGLLAGVKTGQLAAAFVQRADGVHAAGELHVQVQAAVLAQVHQARQRVVVAGVQGQHQGAVVKHGGQCALQLGAQGFNLRGQPGLGQPFGPQQLVGKGC